MSTEERARGRRRRRRQAFPRGHMRAQSAAQARRPRPRWIALFPPGRRDKKLPRYQPESCPLMTHHSKIESDLEVGNSAQLLISFLRWPSRFYTAKYSSGCRVVPKISGFPPCLLEGTLTSKLFRCTTLKARQPPKGGLTG